MNNHTMTEAEALATCTGFVDYPNLKGYFPFYAVNVLLETGKYVIHQACAWGYVLQLVPVEDRARLAAERKAREHGGALEWIDR